MIHGLNHVAVSTPDLERALRFYRDLLGFPEAERFDWMPGDDAIDAVLALHGSSARAVVLHAGNLLLELFEFQSPRPRATDPDRRACDHGICHLALDVTDIAAVHRRLVAAGTPFNAPPQTLWDGTRVAYGHDPDGNVVELQELPGPGNAMWLPALHAGGHARA